MDDENDAWRQPTPEEEGDGDAIIARRVLVDGHGAGTVKSFVPAKLGASSHVIQLDTGGEAKVKLARKGNGKTPWKIAAVVQISEHEPQVVHGGNSPDSYMYNGAPQNWLGQCLAETRPWHEFFERSRFLWPDHLAERFSTNMNYYWVTLAAQLQARSIYSACVVLAMRAPGLP